MNTDVHMSIGGIPVCTQVFRRDVGLSEQKTDKYRPMIAINQTTMDGENKRELWPDNQPLHKSVGQGLKRRALCPELEVCPLACPLVGMGNSGEGMEQLGIVPYRLACAKGREPMVL